MLMTGDRDFARHFLALELLCFHLLYIVLNGRLFMTNIITERLVKNWQQKKSNKVRAFCTKVFSFFVWPFTLSKNNLYVFLKTRPCLIRGEQGNKLSLASMVVVTQIYTIVFISNI